MIKEILSTWRTSVELHLLDIWLQAPWLSTAGEADVGVTHQECINGTVSALQRLKCKIYEVSIEIEWFLVVI